MIEEGTVEELPVMACQLLRQGISGWEFSFKVMTTESKEAMYERF